MKIKSYSVLLFIFTILSTLFFQISYLKHKDKKEDEKRAFIHIIGLPDLAISNEVHYVRHRSLSDTFSLFSNSPSLGENFPSTFVYNYSAIQKNLPSRIKIEK